MVAGNSRVQSRALRQGIDVAMIWFALASLSPVAILAAACLWGGVLPWLALAYVTVFVTAMDRWTHIALPVREDNSSQRQALRLNLVLGLLHLPLLALGVWAVADAPGLALAQRLAIALALGLYLGQVGNSNAHVLIHAPDRWARRLGMAVYISLLFGHHASAHPRIHHVLVASDGDPNSARRGEGFYRFWPRAWIGSFRAGLRAETQARARLTQRPAALSHPYVIYCGGAVLTLAIAFALAGWTGCLVLFGLASYAQMQLLLADYIQHYGLRRTRLANGRLQPVGPQHSWNAPHWYSSAMMLNAPRHSDHHQHPARQFPALRLNATTMPVWPYSMPMMATLALFPGLWRRRMDPHVLKWQAQIENTPSSQAPGRRTDARNLPL